MDVREDVVEIIAGFSLFADLYRDQLATALGDLLSPSLSRTAP